MGSKPRDHRSSGRWCRHRETADTKGHKGTPHTIQQTNHCTPLSSALGQRLQARHAVTLQCGVRLLVSKSRTPPHCEGHSAFQVDNRDEETMGSSTDSTTQWTWGCQVAPPRWLPPTLPRTRIRGGCSCNVGTWSSNEAHREGEGGVQYKEASKVNSALAAVKFVRTLMVQSRFL